MFSSIIISAPPSSGIRTNLGSAPNSAAETNPTPAPEATISRTASRPSAVMAGPYVVPPGKHGQVRFVVEGPIDDVMGETRAVSGKLEFDPATWQSVKGVITVRLAGLISGSLYESIVALGESGELAYDFAEIFAWDVDFSRSVRPGDEFHILYERRYLKSEKGERRASGRQEPL